MGLKETKPATKRIRVFRTGPAFVGPAMRHLVKDQVLDCSAPVARELIRLGVGEEVTPTEESKAPLAKGEEKRATKAPASAGKTSDRLERDDPSMITITIPRNMRLLGVSLKAGRQVRLKRATVMGLVDLCDQLEALGA